VRLDLVAPDGSIHVRVFDGKTREPLPGVSVFLVPAGTGPIQSLAQLAEGGFWQQTTNSSGEAHFPHLRGRRYDVSAGESEPFGSGSVSAHAIERALVALAEGGAESVDLFLRPGLVLLGRVTGPDGEGVSAPIVSLFDERGRPVSGLLPAAGHDDGAYRLSGLSAGTFVARVAARGYAPLERGNVRVENRDVNRADFVLSPGGAIRVTVVDAGGRPVAGADVSFADANGRPVVDPVSLADAMALSAAASGTAPTDEAGRTLREHLAPGTYAVIATFGGEHEGVANVTVRERETAEVRVVIVP
jgi:hypothetical protein